MAPIELEGKSLGEKHQTLNYLVKQAYMNGDSTEFTVFDANDPDVENLIKIDVASKKRNVKYILQVLLCNDLFYVSRALKQSKWIVVEAEYAHITNPHYLNSSLFPQMCTKAINKFIKFIKLNLKNESRVEEFYNYEKDPKKALRWLPNCSVEHIKANIIRHKNDLKISHLKRLCEKSISILEIYLANNEEYKKIKELDAISILLRKDTCKYIELTEKYLHLRHLKFNVSATKLLLKKNSKRITEYFLQYCSHIHLPTFIKFIKKEDIKNFILKHAIIAEDQNYHRILNSKVIMSFIDSIPDEERFELIKFIFIDKQFVNETMEEDEKKAYGYIYKTVIKMFEKHYVWYHYAPFDVAFGSILQLINNKTSNDDKKSMLATLLSCAKQNETHINQILRYVVDKHLHTGDVIYNFLLEFISKINYHKLSGDTWNILELIILEVINNNENDTEALLHTIIIYKVIHAETIPVSIEEAFNFNTLKKYIFKLNIDEKELIFNYLYEFILKKIEDKERISEKNLNELRDNLILAFNLLDDWDKNLKDYPLLLNEVKSLINIVDENSTKINISTLYNIRKNWKRYMFEESLYLDLNEYTLINAIKHDGSLIKRYRHTKQLLNVRQLKKFLQKLRIYFATTLARDMSITFQHELQNTNNHIKMTRGISILSQKTEMLKILYNYAPTTSKTTDSDVDRNTISLQRYFAKNMHFARPHPPPEIILEYAKGDYLQYALPSLLSVFHNLNTIQSRIFIPKLLNSQVSLQKHGIRLAFIKLQPQELIEAFSNIWNTTKNYTIRYVLLKAVFEKLNKEQDTIHIKEIWNLLEFLIDNLTLEENNAAYDLLFQIDKLYNNKNIPSHIKAAYFMKTYPLLKKVTSLNRDRYSYCFYITFISFGREIVEHLLPQFIKNLILAFVNEDYNQVYWTNTLVPLLSSHLLNSKDSNNQTQKYEEIVIPILRLSISNGDDKRKLNKKGLEDFLDCLWNDVPIYVLKSRVFPTQMFAAIQNILEESLPVPQNYIMLTNWKLIVAFIEIVENTKLVNWNDSCLEIAELYGKKCCLFLKEHSEKYFSYIYTLFSVALKKTIHSLLETDVHLNICRGLLHDEQSIEAYLVAIKLIPKYKLTEESLENKFRELCKIISKHPSIEVKIHYYNRFGEETLNTTS